MAKEKSANPVAAHHKQTKRAAINKNKAAVAAAREERLSKRNPARLEKQIAELREAPTLRPKDEQTLKALERELAAVGRARERAGAAPYRSERGGDDDGKARRGWGRGAGGEGDGGGGGGGGGRAKHGSQDKRRYDGHNASSSEDTDDDVRGIPMPRDTPPPIPRRVRRHERGGRADKSGAPAAPQQTTYSSAPIMRDLVKEATATKFAPAAVRRNLDKAKGKGGLVEEQEWERLERAGYAGTGADAADKGPAVAMDGADGRDAPPVQRGGGPKAVALEEVEDEDMG